LLDVNLFVRVGKMFGDVAFFVVGVLDAFDVLDAVVVDGRINDKVFKNYILTLLASKTVFSIEKFC